VKVEDLEAAIVKAEGLEVAAVKVETAGKVQSYDSSDSILSGPTMDKKRGKLRKTSDGP
jgi:hypothetical protein